MMSSTFNALKVSEKINETSDSCSFLLEVPEGLTDTYKYIPGQYLTIKVSVNGEELRRAYSIFTAPCEKKFGFTVKRVLDGKVSNFLINSVSEGDSIEVMNPEGKFIVETQHDLQRDHYFFAGGSGITPIMSMIQSIIEEEPMSSIYLLYCNRNEGSIIFNKKLNDLALNHKGQFVMQLILSQPEKEKSKGIKGLFGKKEEKWKGWKGRIDGKVVQKFLDENKSKSGNDMFYLCGPGGLIESVESYLKGIGIDGANISREYFTNPDQKERAASATSGSADCAAEVTLNGETFNAVIPADKTVLEALMDMGKDPPYSCTSGACSTCVAKISEGKVEMDVCFALDDEEIDNGYVLTCQSRAKSQKLKLVFEN